MNNEQKAQLLPSAGIAAIPMLGEVPVSEVYLMDCISLMKHYPDKWFDLAVVDPPYQDNNNGLNVGINRNYDYSFFKAPAIEYFTELFRVSKQQIIWGGNYFADKLPVNRCWVCWDKVQSGNFSGFELAWTSFDKVSPIFRKCSKGGFLQTGFDTKIHPTQKPISLYDFLFNFFKVEIGAKILDTHLGSGSSRISANKNKLNFVGCEIDEDHFNNQNKRYENFVSQLRIF